MAEVAGLEGSSQAGVSKNGRRFVYVWGVAVLLLGIVGMFVTSMPGYQSKLSAYERHVARMTPGMVEAGRTQAQSSAQSDAQGKPTEVKVGVYVDRIVELSVKDTGWTVDFYIWFNWTGSDVKPGESFQIVDGEIQSRTKAAERHVGDQHYELYRVTARITKFFDVSRFPVDDHLLTISVEDSALQENKLVFVSDDANSSVSSRVSTPGYRIHQANGVVKEHSYKTTRGDPSLQADYKATYSQYIFGLALRRPDWGFYIKVFLGLYAAVALAFVAFFIKPTDVDPRFGLGVGAFFAAIASTYIAAGLLPDTGSMTLTDVVNGVGAATIFLTVVQSTISLYIYDRMGNEALSKLFDKVSIVVFAVVYVSINLAIPLTASI